jgi:predicted acyltransferase
MNMLSDWKLLEFLKPVKPILGIIIDGNVPFIVLSGLIGGLLIKTIPAKEFKKSIFIFIGLGLIFLMSGFILRKWFIISKIQATPSWAMICSGISFLVFILLYWIIDIRNKIKWASFLQPAGENSLTTYIAPDILYYLIWSFGIPILFYKQSQNPLIVVAGSLVWALLMVGLTALLARLKIRLKI